ncbi:MAG: hypothetical protein ABI343_12800 [Burkholderiaceae bacterium]
MNYCLPIIALSMLLTACDIPGLGPDPRIAQREADAKAIGAGCRHALRGIEDCYSRNEKAPKTAVFEGWKEMDQYMRENKLEGISPKEATASRQMPEEEIVGDGPSKAGKDKAAAESSAKPDLAVASSRASSKGNGNGKSSGN